MKLAKFSCIGLSILIVSFSISGCKSSNISTPKNDILTQKKTSKDRTQITILTKYAFSINNFEKAVEEKFDDIDIVQVGNYTSNTVLAKEYETRLRHDDLTDIVMTWPRDVGSEYWEERLLDLAGMDFTSQYNTPNLSTIAKDGKLFYIPGPAQIRGLLYNKTLFEEKGWKVPKNYDEFIALCKQIEASGMRAIQFNLGNEEIFDTVFTGFNYAEDFSTPQDAQWISDYNQGTGKFSDHFMKGLDVFSSLIDQKIIQPSDLDIHYQDTQGNLYSRKTAMIEDSVQIASAQYAKTYSSDEFAVMPFFSPGDAGDWVRLERVCYIGLNKHLGEDKQKAEYEKVMKLMNYISTKEGQTMLASDTGGMFSSLKKMNAPDAKEIKPLLPTLESGRYAQFPKIINGRDALREGLAGMLEGSMNKDEVAKHVDAANANQKTKEKPKVLGSVSEDFTMIDTGSFVCDSMREVAKSDIALFMDNGKDGNYNGKGISAKFYKGDILMDDIMRVFPDIKHGEKGELWKVKMSGKELIKTLEHSMEIDGKTGWFYYFSGLKMTFDPTAEEGNRIKKISLENGDAVKDETFYSVAIMDETLPKGSYQLSEKTGKSIVKIIENAIVQQETIRPLNDKRFLIE
ncbi:MAG: extracellular solute-binding protein [Longicatena sp.]